MCSSSKFSFISKNSRLSEYQSISRLFDEREGIFRSEDWYLNNIEKDCDWEGYISGNWKGFKNGKWIKKEIKELVLDE